MFLVCSERRDPIIVKKDAIIISGEAQQFQGAVNKNKDKKMEHNEIEDGNETSNL